MNSKDLQEHWENIYDTKPFENTSWYQVKPDTSLHFIESMGIDKSARIIDIGGGDSFLVDHLLDLGFENITVLDISKKALDRAKKRLGSKASEVDWVVSDVTVFEPTEKFDLWHDRAALHFLTLESDINKYKSALNKSVEQSGSVVLGTFSSEGPTKCSGIPIKQYTKESMIRLMSPEFNLNECVFVDHKTPFETSQNFIFCSFKRTA